MLISQLNLKNIRAYEEATLNFCSGINLLVGPNNTGKSTILLPLLSLQEGLPNLTASDLRLNTTHGLASIQGQLTLGSSDIHQVEVNLTRSSIAMKSQVGSGSRGNYKMFPSSEPNNFIYPFLANRRVVALEDAVSSHHVIAVHDNFKNLNAKIDRLSNPEFLPAHDFYIKGCEDILGFKITSAHTTNGKKAAYTVHNQDNISLLSMGAGVMNILGLLVNLSMAENKLFLIEEPENDIHPKALKALLDLIIEKSKQNQFIITTHSNIVLKKLGALEETKIFQASLHFDSRMPKASIIECPKDIDSRKRILADLGYDFFDFDIWEGWLILEESSAEKIIREYLIPWFAPGLQQRLRTYAAQGVDEVESKFKDFNDLFVFLNLQAIYKDKSWIILDSGARETEIIERLKTVYVKNGWKDNQFLQFQHHDFENYYPDYFKDQITEITLIQDKKQKRIKKKELLDAVELWIKSNTEEAKKAFEISAKEVIQILKIIESKLAPT